MALYFSFNNSKTAYNFTQYLKNYYLDLLYSSLNSFHIFQKKIHYFIDGTSPTSIAIYVSQMIDYITLSLLNFIWVLSL